MANIHTDTLLTNLARTFEQGNTQAFLTQCLSDELMELVDVHWSMLSKGDARFLRNAACEAALSLKLGKPGRPRLVRAYLLDMLAVRVTGSDYGDSSWAAAEEWANAWLAED